MTARVLAVAVLLAYFPAASAAQVPMDYRIDVTVGLVHADGGEQASGGTSTGPINLNYTRTASMIQPSDRCGHFDIHSDGTVAVDEKTLGGWLTEVTPLKLDGKAMTFRLRWQRVRGGTAGLGDRQEATMTLRLGESATIDVVPFPKEARAVRTTCDTIATWIRVSMLPATRVSQERRLLGVEIWLVERMADGTERTQLLALKGIPGIAMPFYFTAADEGGTKIDIFGEAVPTVVQAGIDVTLNTEARLIEGPNARTLRAQPPLKGPYAQSPNIILKAEEIVSLELPAIDFKLPDGKVARHFSLRLRAKLLRP